MSKRPRVSRRLVIERVAHWQPRLGLAEWEITLQFGAENDGADAACAAQPEYRHAVVRFDLAAIDPAKLDRYVVHELLHCHVWRLANAANSLARGDKAAEEWVRTEEEGLTTALEHIVTRLAQDDPA